MNKPPKIDTDAQLGLRRTRNLCTEWRCGDSPKKADKAAKEVNIERYRKLVERGEDLPMWADTQ